MPAYLTNIRIAQNFIQTLVAEFADSESMNEDYAFQFVSAGIILDQEPTEFPEEEIIDDPKVGNKQDKQMDVIHIDVNENKGFVTIDLIQSKNSTGGIGANEVIQMSNGLSWIFEETDLSRVSNSRLRNKIEEIRDLWQTYTSNALLVRVCLAFKGDTSNVAPEVNTELSRLRERFSGTIPIEIHLYGANEIYELYESNARRRKRVDAEIPMLYDENQPSVMEHTNASTKAVICTVAGRDLAQLVQTYGKSIFDQNLRPYLGIRGDVNQGILNTIRGVGNASDNFWFLNNGITMICDDYSIIKVPNKQKLIRVENVQIVNGCQTTVSLFEAMEAGELNEDIFVLVKVFATTDALLTEQITLTTNTQNRITSRDLHANDLVQRQIQSVLKAYGFDYERKTKEFGEKRGKRELTLVPNNVAAQAYLAIALKSPSIARGFSGRIWEESYYKRIFGDGSTAAGILLSYLIYRYCFLKSQAGNMNDLEDEVAVYGAFHLSRIVGFLIMEEQWGIDQTEKMIQVITSIRQNQQFLDDLYTTAFGKLLSIWEKARLSTNPTLYFKADSVQQSIDAELTGSSKKDSKQRVKN